MIYYFTLLIISIFGLFKWITNLLESKNNLLREIYKLNKDHNDISNENNQLRDLIKIQDKFISDEKLN